LNQKLAFAVAAQSPMTSAKNAYPTYDVAHKKNPKLYNFFKNPNEKLAASFEGLNSSLAQSHGK